MKGLAILIAIGLASFVTSCTHCGDAAPYAGSYASVATKKGPFGTPYPKLYLHIQEDGKVSTTDTEVPKHPRDYHQVGRLCPSAETTDRPSLVTSSNNALWVGRSFTFSDRIQSVTVSRALIPNPSFMGQEIKFVRLNRDRLVPASRNSP